MNYITETQKKIKSNPQPKSEQPLWDKLVGLLKQGYAVTIVARRP